MLWSLATYPKIPSEDGYCGLKPRVVAISCVQNRRLDQRAFKSAKIILVGPWRAGFGRSTVCQIIFFDSASFCQEWGEYC